MKAVLVAAAVMFGAGVAQASTYDHFNRAGYSVQVRRDADGTNLTGRRATGESFKLFVTADNHVTGVWNGRPVDFMLADAGKPQQIALAGK